MSDGLVITLLLLVAALALGLVVMLVIWAIGRYVTELPAEDRQYKDAPPTLFRLMWRPIHWIDSLLHNKIPTKGSEKLLTKLRQGGLDYAMTPSQFIAARVAAAIAFALFIMWVLVSVFNAGTADSSVSGATFLYVTLAATLFGWFYPAIWLKDRLQSRRRELMKTLPFFLDIITLCVEAGLNFPGAMTQAVQKGPKGVLRDEFQRVMRDIRAGKPRAEALKAMAERLNEPGITNFCAVVNQAESMGMNLGPVLRSQADQRRVERFLRAEKLAMEAPVKMLFPLLFFIFPCTFIVIFFPLVMKFMYSGL